MEASLADELVGLARRTAARRRLLLSISLLAGGVSASIAWFAPKQFEVSATFMPRAGSGQLGGIAAAASTLGLNLGASDGGWTSGVFAEVLTSRPLLQALATDTLQANAGAGALYTQLGVGGRTLADSIESAIKYLREELLTVSEDKRLGVVRVTARANDSILTFEVVRKTVQLAQEMHLRSQQEAGLRERMFAEKEVHEAELSLKQAEEAYASFLTRNRNWSQDSKLLSEKESLARQVELRTQLLVTLTQVEMEAGLRESRDTPTISWVQPPVAPLRPMSRPILAYCAIGSLIALILTAAAAERQSIARIAKAMLLMR